VDSTKGQPCDDPIGACQQRPKPDATAAELAPPNQPALEVRSVRNDPRTVEWPGVLSVEAELADILGSDGHDPIHRRNEGPARSAKISARRAAPGAPRPAAVHSEQCQRGPTRSRLTGTVDDRQIGPRKGEVECPLARRRYRDGYGCLGQLALALEGLVAYDTHVIPFGDKSSRTRRSAESMPHERHARARFV
jgi:hypothetical protein